MYIISYDADQKASKNSNIPIVMWKYGVDHLFSVVFSTSRILLARHVHATQVPHLH